MRQRFRQQTLFFCSLPPLSSMAAHSPGSTAREEAVEAQGDVRDEQNNLAGEQGVIL